MNKKLNIGLFGFGVVGEGIYQVLQETPTLDATIKKICIKHAQKKRNAPAHLFTTDAQELLADDTINVIVELIDDSFAAFDIVSTALKNKKSVVSANKKMIAANMDTLLALQTANNVSLLYEASVCGSIPVIRNLEEYYDNDLLHSFSGIVNGSTNFILTKMKEENLTYEKALSQAQVLGFVESNPALDVEGKDAVNKLAIVLKHAYGITTDPEKILHKGITQLHPFDTGYAAEKGFNIKLVANAYRITPQHIIAYILPTFVPRSNPLYNIRNEFNGVLIGSKLADEQFLYGKGAGRFPTASAVLSDIAALRYDYQYEYKKSKIGIQYELTSNANLKLFVSYAARGLVKETDFIQIDESYRSRDRNYMIGAIRLKDLQNIEWFNHPDVSIILVN